MLNTSLLLSHHGNIPTSSVVCTQVYYDEPSTSHKVCDGSGEDASCSNSCGPISCTSISDHLLYLNTPLGSDAC